MPRREAARRFDISESAAIKWVRRWAASGSTEAKPMGGYKRSPLDAHAQWLLDLVAERTDLTLIEVRDLLRGNGIIVGRTAVWAFFRRQDISFKKNRACQRAGKSGRGAGARVMEGRPILA
jgi:transposase